jgi:ribose 1,5-bisphosphate isomerase
MDKEVRRIIADIKSLKIQGARNVAKESLNALIIEAKGDHVAKPSCLVTNVALAASSLAKSRPTEPMMRNLLGESVAFLKSEHAKKQSAPELKKAFISHVNDSIARMEEDAKKLASYGAKLIPDGALVLTHCHSSSSTKILIQAKKMRKKFSVVCFETRPRFQGRKTAAELAKAGIDVTLTVDGAMNLFMKKADIVFVGADSVTSRGDLINKIGTSTLAHIARMNDVSFYSAAELAKYSPMTMHGEREKIEERDPKEVWDRPPRGLKIRNPAFEATASKYINGYVTEMGVIPPESFFSMAGRKLGIRME